MGLCNNTSHFVPREIYPHANDKLLSHNAVLTTSHLGNQTHIFRSDRHRLHRSM